MLQEYKDWIRGVFDRSSNDYGVVGSSYFDRFGKELVEFADLSAPQVVLDVATGKGAVLKALAEKFNGQGNIYGIDISEKMIAATKSSPICQKFNNIHLQKMDAEQLQFPDNYFDAIFCAFAFFFFPHPEQAVSEFRRTLKDEGTLYFSLWDGDTSLDTLIQDKIRELGVNKKIIINEMHSDSPLLRQALKKLGFSKIHVKKTSHLHIYENPEEWWNSLWSHAFRGLFEQLEPSQLHRLKQEALEEIGPYMNEKGQVLEQIPALFIAARE